MKSNIPERIYWRELGDRRPYSGVKGLYGDKAWAQNLDIVNELGGHTGCVNALSWSKSGQLLASGSDDTHLLIHSYQPNGSTSPFTLSTSLSTGHTANIFSVKFMPHSNDRTLVTAAGDAEVRVFDLEYSGQSTAATHGSYYASARQRRQAMGALNQSTRHLTDGNTNARVYRSHSDRVKRIVTESSPYLFLTCSEDGTVRQWDLRQPSSAYPPARGGRGFASHRAGHDDSNVPPPLISYKRYRLDLNTISCSGSQPHYIVLGGAHLHCFLHDRRMLGRDRLAERGASADVGSPSTDGDDKLMGEATRCVRRFAPGGRKKMRRHDNGHVTACKISDANPNEMIASWSGDHIYSFDLLRSPDARDPANQIVTKDIDGKGKGRVKESRERKRKRKQIPSDSSFEQMAPETSKSRLTSDVEASNADRDGDDDDIVLRLRYENGQSEDIPIEPTVSGAMAEQARESMFSEGQKRSLRIAKSLVKIRKLMFSLDTIPHEHEAQSPSPLSIHQSTFTSILGLCASMIPEMNDIDRSWLFPTRPSSHGAAVHATLRKNRDQARRFVLAAGTLARSLGARLQTAGTGESPVAKFFENSPAPPLEGHLSEPEKAFSYYFLKAILHWLKGGPGTLVKGFRKSNSSVRLPIPEDEADESAIERFLIPFLLEMATASRVPDVDTSRFERDESRNLFADESSALTAFSRAVKIPLQDMSRTTAFTNGDHEQGSDLTEVPNVRGQDRETARRYWAFRVGRGLLMKAGEGINFAFVDRAFGGLGAPRSTDEGRAQEDIDPNDEEQQIRSATIKSKRGGRQRIQEVLSEQGVTATTQSSEQAAAESTSSMPGNVESRVSEISIPAPGSESRAEQMQSENEAINGNGDHGLIGAPTDPEQSNDNDDDEVEAHVELDEDDDDGGMDDDEEDNEEDDDDEGSGSDIDIPLEDRHFFWQSLSDRASLREQVQNDIPVSAHTRVYRGHCNIKTIKDVNFFGLQDEYVVSGSDSGHFLIWDKKTSQLLNILEGDGEVVNVVQGHPYEPMLAVSGIDSTIKIFSPDRLAQRDARLGRNLGVSADQSQMHSSLSGLGLRSQRRARAQRTAEELSADAEAHAQGAQVSEPPPPAPDHNEDAWLDEDVENAEAPPGGLTSRRRMHDSYQITSQNDVERQGGRHDAFVTRGMLARLAAHVQLQHGGVGGGGGGQGAGEGEADDGEGGNEGQMIVLDDNCEIM